MATSRKTINISPLKFNPRYQHIIVKEEYDCLSPNQIIPGIFLSSCELAKDLDKLKELNITRIINVTDDIPNYHEDSHIKYLRIPIRDNFEADISKYFDVTYKFIEESLSNGENVLVHCHAGISRSPTIIMAYLMIKNKMKYSETLKIVRTKRNKIDPNLSFIGQLIMLEKKLF